MTTPKPTQKPTVPQPGSRPSIRVDAELSDDLAVLMRPGGNVSDAIRLAVGQLAEMYRTAWAHGVVPDGEAPELLTYQLRRRPTRAPAPTRPYDGTSDRNRTVVIPPQLPGPVPGPQFTP